MDKSDYNTKPAAPGTPLEPGEMDEELPGSTSEERSYYEEKEPLPQPERGRKAPAPQAHPTTELDVGRRGGKPGKPSSGTHPTSELDIRRKR